MKEETASNPGPSDSKIEPPGKRVKIKEEQEEDDPYYFSNLEVQKDIQFEQVKREPEERNEFEEEYEEEIFIEYKQEKYEEEDFSDSQDVEDFEKREEVTAQDSNLLGTACISYPSASCLSDSLFVSNTSILPTPDTSFVWSPDPPPCRPNFSFCGQSGLIKVPSGNDPHDFFNLLFTDEFFHSLVRGTNVFAEELFLRQGSNPRSRISAWKNTSVAEMKIFMGLFFHMGIIKVNKLADYWNRNEKFDLRYFQTRMSRDRWLILQQAFHLARNPIVGDPVPTDSLLKVRPFLELFHKNMKDVHVPAKNVCIDESMVPWKGRISSDQYIPKESIKLYMLTEPDGLIHRFSIYAGAADKEVCGLEHARTVVLKLMSGLLGEGRTIYMDNYYTSVDLVAELLDQQTYVTGILRSSRKYIPSDIVSIKLNKGETTQRWSQQGINLTKWKDKRDVLTISTEFSGDMIDIRGDRACKRKPEVIVKYNKNMVGIDRLNQLLSYYISPRKTLRWYKKINFHVIELMLMNCYILYNRYSVTARRLDLRGFRLAIIDYLCGPNHSPSPPTVSKNVTTINVTHFPGILEVEKEKVRKIRRRCRQCYREKKNKLVSTYCPGCPENPALCIVHCFLQYHREMGFNLD